MKTNDDTIEELERQASGAVFLSILSIIMSLVSIIFALEVYGIYVAERGCL